MDTVIQDVADSEIRLAYVRAVDVADLPEEVQKAVEGVARLYAVHNGEGERLALVRDQEMAFHLARDNNFVPSYVH